MTSSYPESRQRFHHQSRVSMNSPSVMVRNILAIVQIWRTRARFRRNLAALSERELQDMGTCRSFIAYEISKPFWRP
jgi:uncharacterized protein YjiS (DUF1127 family)